MPLIQCPECQREVSSEALLCPQCAFPYPGKKERLNGGSHEALRNCVDCGHIISKQAKTCPHCGSPSLHVQEDSEPPKIERDQETWLCPHCGVPFTRRVKGEKSKSVEANSQQLVSTPPSQPVSEESHATLIAEARQDLINTYRPTKEKRKSPLWGESHRIREEKLPYPRPKKKWNVFLIVIVSVLLVALVSFAFWRLQGLNPLEALVYWQM